MSRTSSEENLEARAQLFKALGHPARLLILNLVQIKPRHGQELALILNLKPATISHHLGRLTDAGLLKSEKDQYYQVYSLVGDLLKEQLGEIVRLPQPGLAHEVEEDAYRSKVLRSFFRRGRLTQIPSQLKKRLIVLDRLAQEFEPDRDYPEREVNRILLDFHEDVAALRRELVDRRFMRREHGVYRRVIPPPSS